MGLNATTMINREQPVDAHALSSLLPEAVHHARAHFTTRRNAFEDTINTQLNEEIADLDEFKAGRLSQLEDGTPYATEVRHEVTSIYDDYLDWIEESMTTEPHPSIKVICALPLTALWREGILPSLQETVFPWGEGVSPSTRRKARSKMNDVQQSPREQVRPIPHLGVAPISSAILLDPEPSPS